MENMVEQLTEHLRAWARPAPVQAEINPGYYGRKNMKRAWVTPSMIFVQINNELVPGAVHGLPEA